jgi:hypothetical protein
MHLLLGFAAAKNLSGTAGLKPEPSIYHSGFDALDCRDCGHSFESRRIGRDASMNSAHLPLLAVAPSQPSRQCSSVIMTVRALPW